MGCGRSKSQHDLVENMDDHDQEEGNKALEEEHHSPKGSPVRLRPKKEVKPRSAITYLLCGIYALVLSLRPGVFPISTSLTTKSPGDPKYYLEGPFLEWLWIRPDNFPEVFHLYIYIMSLIFLVYLHCYLLRQKGEPQTSRGNIRLVSNNQLDSPDKSAFAVQENSEISSHSQKENRSRTPSDVEPFEPFEPRPVTYDSNGVNFYLRLGAIGFGAGSMILDGFRIAQVFEMDYYWSCYGLLGMVMSSMHLVFAFFQTFFLFKNHRMFSKIVINKHKGFVRFGLTHIIATNICIWALETIGETATDYQTKRHIGDVNETATLR